MSFTFDPELIQYVELAEVLNKIPNGFAITDDGSHLKLLKKIFLPEEASLASKLKLSGKQIEEIQPLTDYDIDQLEALLESMHKKGQIRAWTRKDGTKKYALMPFIVGIYEEQLIRMDKELAQLTEEYFDKGRGEGLFDTEPAIFKVLPINKEIKTELEIFPYENAEYMIENSKSWGIRDCICKVQQGKLGNECNYPRTVCISFAQSENAFGNSKITRAITREEALNHLHEAEEAGLIHCTMNIKEQHNYICNCCTCCCGVLKGLTKLEQPHAFVKSNYVAFVEADECIGCETCIDRCQFDALTIQDEICTVNGDKCVGCGACTISCTEDAINLTNRDPVERTDPAENIHDWMTKKAIARQVDPSDIL